MRYIFLDDAGIYPSYLLPRCATLVFQGLHDDTVDPQVAREFIRRMQGRAKLVELDQGHELNADLPGLGREIEAFLQLPRPMP